jgi:hypothetical protein
MSPSPIHRAGRASLMGVWGLVRFFRYWTPVWLPVLLLAQVCFLGLKPALAERDRLEGAEAVVDARYQDAESHFESLDAQFIAWQDPVYQERQRRLRRKNRGSRAEY